MLCSQLSRTVQLSATFPEEAVQIPWGEGPQACGSKRVLAIPSLDSVLWFCMLGACCLSVDLNPCWVGVSLYSPPRLSIAVAQ